MNRLSGTCIIYLASRGSLTKSGKLQRFGALKLSNLENFRALQLSDLKSFMTLKSSNLANKLQAHKTLQSGEFQDPKSLQSGDGNYILRILIVDELGQKSTFTYYLKTHSCINLHSSCSTQQSTVIHMPAKCSSV